MEHLVFVASFLLNSANLHTCQASVRLDTAEPRQLTVHPSPSGWIGVLLVENPSRDQAQLAQRTRHTCLANRCSNGHLRVETVDLAVSDVGRPSNLGQARLIGQCPAAMVSDGACAKKQVHFSPGLKRYGRTCLANAPDQKRGGGYGLESKRYSRLLYLDISHSLLCLVDDSGEDCYSSTAMMNPL